MKDLKCQSCGGKLVPARKQTASAYTMYVCSAARNAMEASATGQQSSRLIQHLFLSETKILNK